MNDMKEIQYPSGFDKELSGEEKKQISDQFFEAYFDAQEPIDGRVEADAVLFSDYTADDDDYPGDGDDNYTADDDDDTTNDDDDDDTTNDDDDDDGNDQRLQKTDADRAFDAWQQIVKNHPGYFVW